MTSPGGVPRGHEDSSLDALARDLASGHISRRGALARLGTAALTAAVPSVLLSEAALAACPDKRKCGKKCCPKGARCRKGRCKCRGGKKKCGRRCVDVRIDQANCGTCGNVCATGQTCVEGQCVGGQAPPEQPPPENPPPTGDCTPGQQQSCYSGPPGTAGVGICAAGVATCTAEATWGPCVGEVLPQEEICNGLDDDCDGVVDEGWNLQADPQNCGECGNVCSFPNATAACVGGTCVVSSCNPGFANCNPNVPGCETFVMNDPFNCGQCGFVCPPGGFCAGGTCHTP